MISLKVNGMENLLDRFEKMQIDKAASTAAVAMAHDVVNRMEYPPATAANRPGRFTPEGRPMGYYERNRGYWRPIVHKVNLRAFGHYGKSKGVILASKTQRQTGTVAGYKLNPSSEQFGKKWKVTRTKSGAVITNSASYAQPLASYLKQARVMKQIGWKTDKQALQESWEAGTFQAAFAQALKAQK